MMNDHHKRFLPIPATEGWTWSNAAAAAAAAPTTSASSTSAEPCFWQQHLGLSETADLAADKDVWREHLVLERCACHRARAIPLEPT